MLVGLNLPPAEFLPRTERAAAELRRRLDASDLPRRRSAGPVLVLEGGDDTYVPATELDETVRRMRANGDAVERRSYPNRDHYGALAAAQEDVVRWLDQRR